MASIISLSPEGTFAFGLEIGSDLRPGEVLALAGDLGAGKTRFVKGVAAGLGYDGEVTSPTFTLIHEYQGGRLPLYHFDFYRLNSEEEVLRLDLEEYFSSGGVVIIEWADKFASVLPREQTRWFRFRIEAGDRRSISDKGAGMKR